MDIAESIISRIIQDKSVSLTQLEQRAQDRAVSLSELYAALDKVSRDKRIKRGVRQGDVYYETNVVIKKEAGSYLSWVRDNYVRMTPETSADHPAFADLDYSFLFLKPDELLEYKAQAKGMPVRMLQSHSKYKQHGQNT